MYFCMASHFSHHVCAIERDCRLQSCTCLFILSQAETVEHESTVIGFYIPFFQQDILSEKSAVARVQTLNKVAVK